MSLRDAAGESGAAAECRLSLKEKPELFGVVSCVEIPVLRGLGVG